MIHLGVSSMAQKLTVELIANGYGYCDTDIHGECPDNKCLNDITIETGLKVECSNKLDVCTSRDAGR